MASIRKKGKNYFIKFSVTDSESGFYKEKSFSLKTSVKRDAERIKLELEDDFEKGTFNPFDENFNTKEYRQHKKHQKMKEHGVTLQMMCDLFLEERPYITTGTANAYKRHFNMMMENWGKTLPVQYITEKDIREFCFKPHLRPKTQNSYLTHLKVFFKWLHEKGILDTNPASRLKKIRSDDEIQKQIITKHEFQSVLDAHYKHQQEHIKKGHIKKDSQKQLWFAPMMALYYYAGLRLSEGISLRWSRVDFSNRQLHVVNSPQARTKSGKDRTVQMRKQLLKILKEWHKLNGEPSNTLVFPSPSSSDSHEYKLRSERVSKAFKKFARLAGLSEDITLHSLRHTCVTDLIRDGVGLVEVMRIAGHASLETTRIYEHISSNDIRDKFKALDI